MIKMGVTVLVIGSGGREHALSWKLAQSEKVEKVVVSPGNAGTNGGKIVNVSLDINDYDALSSWCKSHQVALVVVGPEDPLANGISDALTAKGIAVFGPCAAAAQIEASKSFAKTFMDTHGIPTARWKSFTEANEACDYINGADFPALVVKASGLAAGKGVIVAKDKSDACDAVKTILDDKKFGSAGSIVVVEELLEGEEVSCLAFTDGTSIVAFPPAQDHKRIQDGDQGPNTGGMGAYCPCPLVSDSELEIIKRDVLQKAVDGLRKDGMPFVGVLYAGLMLTKNGPKTLEYNCRFGDPETQVLLPLLKSDLFEVMQSCCNGNLTSLDVKFEQDSKAVAVVLVSEGYPGSYKKGCVITGCEKVTDNLSASCLPGGDNATQLLVFHAGTTLREKEIVTSGGRVMAMVALDNSLARASNMATLAAKELIDFQGKFYRKDIAHKALKKNQAGLSYASSGVSIQAGEDLVNLIKPFCKATSRKGCTVDLGMFGGIFDLKATGFTDPLLVSGTDGVGTKLKIAQSCDLHSTVGIDLVAMCVNDILAHGAEPLFFLDYFACGRLDVGTAAEVVKGIAEGCKQAGCALIGGETAEMPGMYAAGEYDLAGFAVGAVERDKYIPNMEQIKDGDVVMAMASSGVHSNGFSLVRKVVEYAGLKWTDECPFDSQKSLGEALLTPTKIYCQDLLPALRTGLVKAFAHITGGGLVDNVPRVLPNHLAVALDAAQWDVPAVFGWLAKTGQIPMKEMAKTFNCGVGGVLIVDQSDVKKVTDLLGSKVKVIGKVTKHDSGQEKVQISTLENSILKSYPTVNGTVPLRPKVKVGVLISGSGTNLQALIDSCQTAMSYAEIVLVISNKPGVKGLDRASSVGIPTKVINHKEYKDRETFDAALHEALIAAGVELVCLAGFMRILTGGFVRKWDGKMINVHPSLLPSFKGHDAPVQAIKARVVISGCTAHFVCEEVDAGAILVQESVPVLPNDTVESLHERIKTKEHVVFPKAMQLVAAGKAKLGPDNVISWNL